MITTPLQKEIERLKEELASSQWNANDLLKQRDKNRDEIKRLREEVEKAFIEGINVPRGMYDRNIDAWNTSRAKRVTEGKE